MSENEKDILKRLHQKSYIYNSDYLDELKQITKDMEKNSAIKENEIENLKEKRKEKNLHNNFNEEDVLAIITND